MSDYLPLYRPGQTLTFRATAAITGGTPVELGISDWSIQPAAADSLKVVGIAGHDAAIGDQVTVESGRVVHELTAGAAITRGSLLGPAGGGKVKTVAAGAVWLALNSAAADKPVAAMQL